MLACIRRGQPEIRGAFSFLSRYLQSKDSTADPLDPLSWDTDTGGNTDGDGDSSPSQGRCPTGLRASPQSLLYNPSPFPASPPLALQRVWHKRPELQNSCRSWIRALPSPGPGRDSSRPVPEHGPRLRRGAAPHPAFLAPGRLPRQRSGRCSMLIYPPGLKERSDGRKAKTSPEARTRIPILPLPPERGRPLLAARRRGRGLTMTRPTRGRRRRTMRDHPRPRPSLRSGAPLTLPSTPWSREPPCLLGSPGSGAERQRFRGCPSLASGKRRAVPGNPRGRARRGPAAPLGASRPATATSRPPSAPAGPGGARSRWHRCGPAGRLSPRGVRVCARVCVRVCVCVCVCPPRGGGDFTSARRWLRQDWKV